MFLVTGPQLALRYSDMFVRTDNSLILSTPKLKTRQLQPLYPPLTSSFIHQSDLGFHKGSQSSTTVLLEVTITNTLFKNIMALQKSLH